MNASLSARLFEAAMQLPADEREVLALALLETTESLEDATEVEQAWREEVARRVEAVRSGATPGIPWQQARASMFQP